MSTDETAAQTVRDIIEASRYLVLATADTAGRPWSTPVYFAHVRPGAGLRLYRAAAGSHSILAKDGRPDHRIPVPLT